MADETEAQLAADFATVRSRRVKGIRSTSFRDRNTAYISDSESRQIESDIARDLNRTRQRSRQTFAVASKGLADGRG